MSDVIQNILTRRSVRKYKPDMVPRDVVDKIVKAGTYAPTGLGTQSPIILVITNKLVRDKLARLNGKAVNLEEGVDPFYGAPVVLAVLAEKKYLTHVNDGSLVIGNMLLAAHDQKLGSCWIHGAREEFELPEGKEMLRSLGIEGEYEGIGHCILGYADGPEPEAAPRKDSYAYYIE